jgi:hypothetical protein
MRKRRERGFDADLAQKPSAHALGFAFYKKPTSPTEY